MEHNYKHNNRSPLLSGILRISIISAMILVWILIDKGNIYGQSLSDRDVMIKQSVEGQVGTPLFREDGDDGRGGEIPTENEDDAFVTRPNPVQSELVFDFEFTVKTGIPYQVIDPLGRLAAQGTFEPGISSQTIDFSRLKAGLYIVSLDMGNKIKTARVIKQ